MTSVEERTIFAKLEVMKDIRMKTIQLEKIKLRIINQVENSDAEEKCLAEYRRELELLMQEKMSHVEELRQIHADINAMETVIKQAEENRQRSIGMANRLHEEFAPLKTEIDTMRREYLGLERLPELHEEEGSIIAPERFQQQQHTNFYTNKITTPSASFTRPTPVSALAANPATAPHHPLPPNDNPHITPLNPTHGFLPPAPPSAVNHQGLRGAHGLSAAKPSEISNPVSRIQQPTSLGMHPTFRQQPPPMKSCLSCHQQIHRNAPICPLCKAKSRSRNPKKPKKKDH
ncbi:hypothetical protein PVAND_005336 [Polypedilum vanderplanki]|uniref:C4H2-type domain-containing protein n=1 Tax=Polypedilum vanderplanki TaxID=319348 RepID=A0A9J6C037_POLVA|nr:hypothetical protein PVAND_005336 [Polypedilum vanderplanki]